jgi:hypothetical protein
MLICQASSTDTKRSHLDVIVFRGWQEGRGWYSGEGCAVVWSVGPFLDCCLIEWRYFSRASKKRGPLGRVLLDGCCQSEIAGSDRPGQGGEDGFRKHAEGLQELCKSKCVCVCEWRDWRNIEMGNEYSDLSCTLCQQTDCPAPRLVTPSSGYVGDSEVTRRMQEL